MFPHRDSGRDAGWAEIRARQRNMPLGQVDRDVVDNRGLTLDDEWPGKNQEQGMAFATFHRILQFSREMLRIITLSAGMATQGYGGVDGGRIRCTSASEGMIMTVSRAFVWRSVKRLLDEARCPSANSV